MTANPKKAVPKDLIDSLMADYKKPEDLADALHARDKRKAKSDG